MIAMRQKSSLTRSFVSLAADIQTALVARRLRRSDGAVAAQRRVWRSLVARLAVTAHGRATGIERGLSAEAWRRRTAPRLYEEFSPWIERMKRGEADVLWPGRCAHYAISSGTTAGRTKYLPPLLVFYL